MYDYKDSVCAKGLYCLSEQCDKVRAVPGNCIQKTGQRIFNSNDFVELISVSSSKGNQKSLYQKINKFLLKCSLITREENGMMT